MQPGRAAAAPSEAAAPIDLELLLDGRPVSTFQIQIFLLCGLVGILDGLNTMSIGVAAKAMAADFRIPLASFGPVFAAMLLGATIGAIVFGVLGDRFGRKQPIIVAVAIIAMFTLSTPAVHSVRGLVVIRFLLGLGLGGATPGFLALGSEYAPARLRQRLVSVLWLSFPGGGVLGAFLNAYLLAHHGWRTLFYVGGAVPMLLLPPLVFGLPESIRFLAARNRRPAAVAGILRRLAPDLVFGSGSRLIAPHEAKAVPAEALPRRRDATRTFVLWCSFLVIYGTLTALTLWVPALLAARGMAGPDTAIAVGFDSFGALIGVGIAGTLLERFGRIVLVLSLIMGAISVAAIGPVGDGVLPVIVLMTVAGFFVGLGSSGVIVLVVRIHPTASRSRGLGWAMGAGRLGQFIVPLVIGLLVRAAWTVPTILLAIAVLPLLGAIFILSIRNDQVADKDKDGQLGYS